MPDFKVKVQVTQTGYVIVEAEDADDALIEASIVGEMDISLDDDSMEITDTSDAEPYTI
jgi:hypothetical protein